MTLLRPSHSTRPWTAWTAGGAAGLGAVVAVLWSAPSLTRPLSHSLPLVWLAPALVAGLLALVFRLVPWFGRMHRARAFLSVGVAVIPWVAIGMVAMARSPALAVAAGGGAALLAPLLVGRGFKVGLGVWILGAAVLAVPRGTLDLQGERSTIILGFDAATWTEIDKLIDQGELPAFARMKKDGTTGILLSDEVTLSPRVWTNIATGVPAQEHGILSFDFHRSALKTGRVWDEVVAQGGSAGVVGWLVNWPPDPHLEFSFPGWIGAGNESVPAESSFVSYLEDAFRTKRIKRSIVGTWPMYRLVFQTLAFQSADHAVELGRDLWWCQEHPQSRQARHARLLNAFARMKADLYLELLDRSRPQFSALVTYPTDALAHDYWRHHEPEAFPGKPGARPELGEVVRNTYRIADDTVRRVLERIDLEHTTVLLVSDHGMEANRMEERAMLISGTTLLETVGMEKTIQASRFARMLVLSARETPESRADLERLETILREATVGEDRRPAFRLTRHADEPVIKIRFDGEGEPTQEMVQLGDRTVSVKLLCYLEDMSGDHTRDGILAMIGPGVRAGGQASAVLEDIAPTSLFSMGLSVPEELRGQVIRDAYLPQWLEEHLLLTHAGGIPAPQAVLPKQKMDLEADLEKARELGYIR